MHCHKRYIELDSTFRNRKQYPNPSDFVVPYQISGSYNNCIEAFDPVCLSSPFETSSGASLSTTTTIVLPVLISSSTENFYINYCIGLIDTSVVPFNIQYSKIVNYTGNSRTVTSQDQFTLPLGVYYYVIRKQLPTDIPYSLSNTTQILQMTSIVNFTPSVITIQPSMNNYEGMMIRLISNSLTVDEYQIVSSYDPSTSTIHTSRPFSLVFTTNDYYELLPFSRDNSKPLKYQGTSTMNQPVCYSVRLVNIAIPFIIRSYMDNNGSEFDEKAIIDVANGGTIDQYPCFYVCLYSDIHRDNIQTIITNNPNTSYAVFRVPISSGDTPGPKKIMSQTNFTRCDMCPVIKLLPNDTFRMTVMLPNGEILSFRQKDNLSPKEPNYKLQISALFELNRME